MTENASIALSRRPVLLGVVLLGVAGCMRAGVDAPPASVVFFTNDSTALDRDAQRIIGEAAKDALANPSKTVFVQGFAERGARPNTNLTLSQQRAQVVADGLVALGVPRSRIQLRPRGQTDLDPGVESRRVEITFAA